MQHFEDRGKKKEELKSIAERVKKVRRSWTEGERSARAEAGQVRRTDLYRLLLGLQPTASMYN